MKTVARVEEERWLHDHERRFDYAKLGTDAHQHVGRVGVVDVLLSRGFSSDLKDASKLSKRVALGALCIALIGGAGQPGVSAELAARIADLDELRVNAERQQVEQRWAQQRTKETSQEADAAGDRRAIDQLTRQFTHALLRNPHWQARWSRRAAAGAQEDLVRLGILGEVRKPDANGHDRSVATADLNSAERELLDDVTVQGRPSTTERAVADELGQDARSWLGDKWARVKKASAARAASYRTPAAASDLDGALLDHIIGTGFDQLPDFGPSELDKQLRSSVKKGLSKMVGEAVKTEFKHFIEELSGTTPLDQALTDVETRRAPIGQQELDDVARALVGDEIVSADTLHEKAAKRSVTWLGDDDPDGFGFVAESSPDGPSGPTSGGPAGGDSHGGGPSGGSGGSAAHGGHPRSTGPRGGGPRGGGQVVDDLVDGLARSSPSSRAGTVSELQIDALASYDDFFPASAAHAQSTPLARQLQRRGDAGLHRRTAIARAGRARSFGMLSGSARVGGVLLGRSPVGPRRVLDLRDLSWSIAGTKLELFVSDAHGKRRSLGHSLTSTVHQALAFAADGRPVAVTMTNARPLQTLKIHLHPALEDTPLGCRVLHLDRFVDESSHDFAEREQLQTQDVQLKALYNFAWAVRAELLLGEFTGSGADDFRRVIEHHRRELRRAGFDKNVLRKPRLFEQKPEFFDPQLVDALWDCVKVSSVGGLEQCLGAYFRKSSAFSRREQDELQQWVLGEAEFMHWSEVRETPFSLDSSLSFMRAPATAGAKTELWPLDFGVQVAFLSPPIAQPHGDENWADQEPYELRELKPAIMNRVAALVRTQKAGTWMAELREFVVLQRFFRAALAGDFGSRFPLAQLRELTRVTAGSVRHEPTARWNGSDVEIITRQLEMAAMMQSDATLAVQVRSCLTAVADAMHREESPNVASSCDFERWFEPSRESCMKTGSSDACSSAGLFAAASRLSETLKWEHALGVQGELAGSSCGPIERTP